MKISKLLHNVIVVLLAALFTISLFYLTLEFHNLLNKILFPVFPGTSTYIVGSPLIRLIGLICLCFIITVIILGFIVKRLVISKVGSFVLFLPTFAHFFMAMFLLIGLQAFQIILLPLDSSEFNILTLGSIIKLPYMIIDYLASFSSNADLVVRYFCYGIILIGLIIFAFGVIAWLQRVIYRKEIVDFSIYKYSRHPQFLGYLIWSYGIYLLTLIPITSYAKGAKFFEYTFVWFLSALIIIGIALYEEIMMDNRFPEKYDEYRKKTPFLIPLPNFIKTIITAPLRLVFKRDLPKNRKEIIFLLAFYGSVIIIFSLLLNLFIT
ncbi:MAG: methyltransferase family protein [Promethearchaeota archaeon]